MSLEVSFFSVVILTRKSLKILYYGIHPVRIKQGAFKCDDFVKFFLSWNLRDLENSTKNLTFTIITHRPLSVCFSVFVLFLFFCFFDQLTFSAKYNQHRSTFFVFYIKSNFWFFSQAIHFHWLKYLNNYPLVLGPFFSSLKI